MKLLGQTAALMVGLVFITGASGQTLSSLPPVPDCGEASVFTLLELWGQPTPLEKIKISLPADRSEGRSIAELQETARRFGVPTVGVRLTKSDFPLDQPVIAYFLKSDGEGHYVAPRPIGVTGTMAQVINYPMAPEVADYADLLKSPGWTGVALVPQTFGDRVWSWLGWIGGAVCFGSLSILAGRWALAWRSRIVKAGAPQASEA